MLQQLRRYIIKSTPSYFIEQWFASFVCCMPMKLKSVQPVFFLQFMSMEVDRIHYASFTSKVKNVVICTGLAIIGLSKQTACFVDAFSFDLVWFLHTYMHIGYLFCLSCCVLAVCSYCWSSWIVYDTNVVHQSLQRQWERMLGYRKAPPRLFEFFIARVNHGDPHHCCLPVFIVGLVPVATPSKQIVTTVVSAKSRSWII